MFQLFKPYRQMLLHEAETRGLPPARHGILVYPEDNTWFNETKPHVMKRCNSGHQIGLKQFFFGDDVLVAPVIHPRTNTIAVYIPGDTWIHAWSKKAVVGPSYDTWPAPIGQPAIFFRNDSRWASFFHDVSARVALAT